MIERSEIFSVKGPNTFQCKSDKIKINPEKSYLLSGEFKSIGTTLSKLHFGIMCFGSNDQEITPQKVIRKDISRTITSFDTTFKSFTLDDSAQIFAKGFIGLYYDGNTDKLPDKLISGQTVEGNAINFTKALPKEIADLIVVGKTKVMHHGHSKKVHMYNACDGKEVPKEWTTFSASFRGFAWGEGVNGKFRKGTCYACPIIIAHHSQDSTAVLEMKNVFLTAVCDFS